MKRSKAMDKKILKLRAMMQAYEAAKSMGIDKIANKLDAKIRILMKQTKEYASIFWDGVR